MRSRDVALLKSTSVVTLRTSRENYARSPIASLSVMTRTRFLVDILTHTDGRNYILEVLKFLVTLIYKDYTHKRVSALTKLAECQLTLNILFTIFFAPMYIFGVCNIQHISLNTS